ncbi:OmpA family protein [Aliivibrio fischeri]|uniref:OmpA family protein n=1 Tax=Aliivibrio fischeri TaxID=668 RepID=UPI0012D9EC97|nr:OmpA family protein [Aliivibrio fischeri]MUL04114.1 OmpA family protein [Aliivibrio fischeri]MUL06660.1 OmpA family protein [Aliivibrio fischeri]
MKLNFISYSVSFFLLTSTALMAKEVKGDETVIKNEKSPFHFTAAVGFNNYQNLCSLSVSEDCDNKSPSGRIGMDYDILDNMALTMDYRYLGKGSYGDESVSTDAWTVGTQVKLPLSEHLKLTGSFGVGVFNQDLNENSDSYMSSYLGTGLSYKINNDWYMNFDYTYYNGNDTNMNGDVSIRPDINEFTIGFTYYFNKSYKIHNVETVVTKEKVITKQNNVYVVPSDGQFIVGSYKLSNPSRFNFVYDYLSKNPRSKAVISGYTDSTGSGTFNLKLSEQRAEEVASYISKRGISKDRLISKGLGESKPVASNLTKEGRVKNRRVEVLFKDDI